MPEHCGTCNRFLVEGEGEGYLQHLNEHNEVQKQLFGAAWTNSPALGYCHHIVRDGELYHYEEGRWLCDTQQSLPPINHHEWM
jgi:hypothetical protein